MARKVYKKIRPFFYLVPVVALFALGILLRSAQKVNANACGCDPLSLNGGIDLTATVGSYEGNKVVVPNEDLASDLPNKAVLGVADPNEKWIEVDLSDQKVRAWDGTKLFLESPVSTGLPGLDTPKGEFRIWMKVRATRMTGGEGRLAYDLPNVPYVMFFSGPTLSPGLGYSLHGTYWHNDFGRVHSHGCVNLPTPVAHQLYDWTSPSVPDGKSTVRTADTDFGTRIIIHE